MVDDPIEFDMTLETADLAAWSLRLAARSRNVPRDLIRGFAFILVCAFIGIIIGWLAVADHLSFGAMINELPGLMREVLGVPLLAGCAFVVAFTLARPRLIKNSLDKMIGAQPGVGIPQKFHVRIGAAEGLRFNAPNLETHIGWSAVIRCEETVSHFFLVIGPLQCIVIPKRGLPDATVEAISDMIKSLIAAAAVA